MDAGNVKYEPPSNVSSRAWNGAAVGAWLAAGALIFWVGWKGIPVFGDPLDLLLWLAAGLVAPYLVGWGAASLLYWMNSLPPRFLWLALGSALVAVPVWAGALWFGYGPVLGRWEAALIGAGIGLLVLALEAAFGAALLALLTPALPGGYRALAGFVLLVTAALNLAGMAWLLARQDPGPALVEEAGRLPQIEAENPALPGGFAVKTLVYGSGSDRRRPDFFGSQVEIDTRPVNGAPFLKDWKAARTRYWGFDPQSLPLNGQVWYPEGDGPFPLFVFVHGQHPLYEPSDAGYGYLGELLASRGTIFVSIDENFLNNGPLWLGILRGENDARGWLLLQHMAAWAEWNEDESSPFFQKIDLDRLAVGGHSRGGEAAAIAAAFNELPYYPDNASVPFNFHFAIRAVAALAPVEGQYQPAGRGIPLRNLSYLALHGAYDADVAAFEGTRQFQRVQLDGAAGQFKAAVYIDRANHTQFNTVWGEKDKDPAVSWLLDGSPLMDSQDQRQAAMVFLSAFLEAALQGRQEYLPLFADPRRAGEWLPPARYRSQFEEATFRLLAGYEEDIDVTSASLAGSWISGERLFIWQETALDFALKSFGELEGHAVLLGWKPRSGVEAASYSIRLEEGLPSDWRLDREASLAFSLADPALEVDLDDRPAGFFQMLQYEAKPPTDLSLVLMDASGQAASLPLSRFGPLPQAFSRQFTRLSWLERETADPVFQTYLLPLADFAEANPAFDPARLREIRFVFDLSDRGLLALDQVGLMNPAWGIPP